MHTQTQAMSPLGHLMGVMENLITVLDAEPELVKTRKMAAHKDLLHRKQRLLADYEHDLKSLRTAPEVVKAMTPDQIATMDKTQTQLELAVARNAKALKIAIESGEQLMDAIIAAIRAETKQLHAYQAPAQQLAGVVSAKAAPAPALFNRNV